MTSVNLGIFFVSEEGYLTPETAFKNEPLVGRVDIRDRRS